MVRKKRKNQYLLRITRIEAIQVHDKPGHALSIVEMEGEPIGELDVGVAGEFISRRSVSFLDRTKGTGPMLGYSMAYFRHGSVYTRFEGQRVSKEYEKSTGTWKIYDGTGKLAGITGEGTFKITLGERRREFILDFEGEYEL
ncbi:MAG: hypothetical protein WBB46_08675 [Candidatus Deferrimicrobiaceae bacterium]